MQSKRCCMLLLWTTTRVSALSMRNVTTNMMSSALSFHALDSVESTQEEARKLLSLSPTKPYLAVSAKQQHKGRGTSGRIWKGMTGNVFLTVALPMTRVPVPITLLPLQVGILIATTLNRILQEACDSSRVKLTLKWPNDVLINQKKVAGVLIESETVKETTYLLVGVGINIQQAPQIAVQEGRAAACLQEYCSEPLSETTAEVVAAELSNRLVEWMEHPGGNDVVQEWRTWAEFNTPQKLRDTGEVVIPLNIQDDGQLLVRQENGQERLLVAEYLY